MSVIEHTFAPELRQAETEPDGATKRFDFRDRVDSLRCRSTRDLRRYVTDLAAQEQQIRLERLAVTRVLDDRHALGALPDPKASALRTRTELEVARALESLPAVSAAAHEGSLSWDQLAPVARVATPATDAEWATRAPNVAPVDLQRMARAARKVTTEDAAARRAARAVFTWREAENGMACGRWALPDVDGVLVDKVLDHMAERMRPAKGLAWDSLAHRKADALVELARTYADAERTGRSRVEIVQITDQRGAVTSEVEGIPLAPGTVDALRPDAKTRDAVLDDTGTHTTRRPRTALPADVERHVRRRDHHCRVLGCEATRGIQIHHTNPICHHGDSHDPRELAAVCPPHHAILEPHGPYRLVGNPEAPDSLTLVHRNDQARDGPDP
ncbi:MAG TPA: DUF222 domain-containing protein [Acidimicrobiia bacterium]|nr:DUF222 domain-containing protein [Acidimicrobiia bacterium]